MFNQAGLPGALLHIITQDTPCNFLVSSFLTRTAWRTSASITSFTPYVCQYVRWIWLLNKCKRSLLLYTLPSKTAFAYSPSECWGTDTSELSDPGFCNALSSRGYCAREEAYGITRENRWKDVRRGGGDNQFAHKNQPYWQNTTHGTPRGRIWTSDQKSRRALYCPVTRKLNTTLSITTFRISVVYELIRTFPFAPKCMKCFLKSRPCLRSDAVRFVNCYLFFRGTCCLHI
jgi:hypothetical protein